VLAKHKHRIPQNVPPSGELTDTANPKHAY